MRFADPEVGVFEAADLQWWWRTPRRSNAIDQWKLDEWFAGTLPEDDPALDASRASAPSIPQF